MKVNRTRSKKVISNLGWSLIALLYSLNLSASYLIEGRVNYTPDWQNQIFLAAIEDMDGYFRANPDLIVDAAIIDQDGNFRMEGNMLPDEKRFYRLYLMKEVNSEFDVCLYVGGEDHNFVHLIMDNDSQVRIHADSTDRAPFGHFDLVGDKDNQLMKSLSDLVYPSYYYNQIKFPSELRFTEDRLTKDLFSFADSTSSSLVSLAATINTDITQYYDDYKPHYLAVKKRLKESQVTASYIADYQRKLDYFDIDEIKNSRSLYMGLSAVLGLLSLALLAAMFRLRKKAGSLDGVQVATTTVIPELELTKKETTILQKIIAGKSNKEIADEEFIALSTVKTHINKLYGKMSVKNRKEAIIMGKEFIQNHPDSPYLQMTKSE